MTDKLRHGPLWTTIFAIISLIWIYPIALVFINSFKKRVYISKDVFSLPTGDTFVGLENYERGIEKTDILPSFGWTIILTLGSVALILLCCSMCAWWIVRVNNWVAKLMLSRVYRKRGGALPDGHVPPSASSPTHWTSTRRGACGWCIWDSARDCRCSSSPA